MPVRAPGRGAAAERRGVLTVLDDGVVADLLVLAYLRHVRVEFGAAGSDESSAQQYRAGWCKNTIFPRISVGLRTSSIRYAETRSTC
ncbi:hypothetical protein ABZV80_44440 [Streptomyces sp. NPDC005132]|uniref:hypothetical protein n=1 Tax=Streptomyces sp. NPDC005132 TaxID=3154294 RepID=UPI0033A2EF28